MATFINVLNEFIKSNNKATSLAEKGLYYTISAFLSNPNFVASKGGFKADVLKHSKEGQYSFNSIWNKLKDAGLLKKIRMSYGLNKFSYRYELLTAPDFNILPLINLNNKESQNYLANPRPIFTVPKTDYTAVSYHMLMDNSLSCTAKGLFAVIRRLLEMAKYKTDIVVSKSLILDITGLGVWVFNTAWKQLKQYGYLEQRRSYCHEVGHIIYEYNLHDEPFNDNSNTAYISKNSGQPMQTTDDRK